MFKSASLSIPSSGFAPVKARLEAFLEELTSEVTWEDGDKPYQLNLQMFPVDGEMIAAFRMFKKSKIRT